MSRRDAPLPVTLRAAAFLVALAVAASGCGYSLQPGGKNRFSDPSVRIDLSPFANYTSEADAGPLFAARLREELRRSGFRGAFGQGGADFVVEGKVREIRDDVFSHGTDRFALEHRLTVVAEIRVVEVVRGGVLWKETGIGETASYFSGPDAQYKEANRRAALEEAVRRVVLRMAQTIRVIL